MSEEIMSELNNYKEWCNKYKPDNMDLYKAIQRFIRPIPKGKRKE